MCSLTKFLLKNFVVGKYGMVWIKDMGAQLPRECKNIFVDKNTNKIYLWEKYNAWLDIDLCDRPQILDGLLKEATELSVDDLVRFYGAGNLIITSGASKRTITGALLISLKDITKPAQNWVLRNLVYKSALNRIVNAKDLLQIVVDNQLSRVRVREMVRLYFNCDVYSLLNNAESAQKEASIKWWLDVLVNHGVLIKETNSSYVIGQIPFDSNGNVILNFKIESAVKISSI